MTDFYVDTSALLKRYLKEPGTSAVDLLFNNASPGSRFHTSFFTVLEVCAALLRPLKAGQLTQRVVDVALAQFGQDTQGLLNVWPVDQDVLTGAKTVVMKHRLRAPDAIHLSTALDIRSVVGDVSLVLVASDKELLQASAEQRLVTLNPQEPKAEKRIREFGAIK